LDSRSRPHRVIEFGKFHADLDSGELFKDGLKVRLSEQPFQLLVTLLECPGDLVSREELRHRLWPEDIHLDFDRSLNTAASKLREALGDPAHRSLLIETVPKRGYRFIAPLNETHSRSPITRAPWEKQAMTGRPFRRAFLWAAISGASALTLASAYFRWHASSSAPAIVQSFRLTNDDFNKNPELATDGTRIYFSAWKGGHGVLAQVSTAGGDTELMLTPPLTPERNACVRTLSPDKQWLLVATGKQRTSLAGYTLWTVSPTTLASRKVGDLVANDAGWSPDSRRVAYATQNQIWVADSDGGRPHKIAEAGGLTGYPRWSPDGQRIRFTSLAWETYQQSIWEVAAEGGAVRPIFPNWTAEQWGGQWAPDGSFYVFNSDSNIWAVGDRAGGRGRTFKPVQLTFGPLSFLAPICGTDSRTLYAVGEIRRGELLRYDTKLGRFDRFFPGLSADGLEFSRDGQWMTYVSYPQQELWRSRVDGSERQLLTSSPLKAWMPHWSPDGRQIAFNARKPGEPWKAYLVGAGGGVPREVAPGLNSNASWSPDGTRLAIESTSKSGNSSLLYLELRTGKLSRLPGGDGLAEPKWSPDGRYIGAEKASDFACMLFDVNGQNWSEIAATSCWFQSWTRDSKSFFSLEGKSEAIQRFDVQTRRFERLQSLRDYRIAGNHTTWLGISPEGSPLILRDAGSQEIYGFKLRMP
jgi:Tol biopolymer transport system component/DNA-binding winged helix-turn-helix (wHTH) protein